MKKIKLPELSSYLTKVIKKTKQTKPKPHTLDKVKLCDEIYEQEIKPTV